MEEGSNFQAVFSRLSKACSMIQEQVEFARTAQLGYITTRPSTLGTALRISVLLQLPKLKEHRKEFFGITERYSISFRAIIKTSSQPHEHLYELSNRKRLGASEVELVQDMHDAVKEMIALQRALSRPPDTPCGRQLRFSTELRTYPGFTQGHKKWSLLRECLSREMWDKYEDEVDASGYSFKSVIFPGCQNEDAEVGVYAGSEDSYKAFSELMYMIIRFYHRTDLSIRHESCFDIKQL